MKCRKKPRCNNRFSYKIHHGHGTRKFVLMIALKGNGDFVPLGSTAWAKRLPVEFEFSQEQDAQTALAEVKQVLESPDLYKRRCV